MDKKKLTIINDQVRERALTIITRLPLDPVHEVIIREHSENRSLDQNALMWRWLTFFGKEIGSTKDEMHREMKKLFLLPIYLKDPVKHMEVCTNWSAIRDLSEIAHDARQAGNENLCERLTMRGQRLYANFIYFLSTTEASVKEMTEYLTDIDHHAAGMDISLPRRQDERL